jgi:uroporphyrinogen decarboxylase
MHTGKELIKRAFKLKSNARIPWVPFVGCHGASLIGAGADEYLKSADLMIKGITKAIELYKPDGIPIIFDLQVEAEVMGCKLNWTKENPPSVVSHPLKEGKDLNEISLPDEKKGRIPIIIDVLRKIKKNNPDIAIYALVTGPFTLGLHLLGTDIFLKMYEDPKFVKEVISFSTEVAKKMVKIYLENGCDIIAIVDPMTSQIDTDSFLNFISEPISDIFEIIKKNNGLSSFFVCGNAYHNIEAMCSCRPDNISIDENIPLDYVKEVALANNVSFGGNLKLTSVLLLGNNEENKKHAVETMDIGEKNGFILSPGCDIPMSTPSENLIAISEVVLDEYEQEKVRQFELKSGEIELIDLKDHFSKAKIVIDIITIDSGSCAPCQYMVEAVESAAIFFSHGVHFEEHKIKEVKGLSMMKTLGVTKIPTICFNGKPVFISKIPSHKQMLETIKKYLND